jgi:hypothetical protein
MSDVAVHTRPTKLPVSREFVGRARQLVDEIAASDKVMTAALKTAFEPLKQRMRKSPSQRVEDLAATVRALDQLPDRGRRIAHTREFDRSRRTLDDWRLIVAGGQFTKESWVNPSLEPALLVCMVTLKVVKRTCALNCDVLFIIGLHSLARFYQRSFKIDRATLFSDLAELGLHYDILLESTREPPHQWRRETENGVWVGEAMKRDTPRIILSCDSFV